MTAIEKILAEEKAAREEFEAKTLFKGEPIALLRKTFEAVQNPQGWKLPWSAAVPHTLVHVVMLATEFFHADKASVDGIEALTGNVLMSGNGYQAW